jgi:hypothetical protein
LPLTHSRADSWALPDAEKASDGVGLLGVVGRIVKEPVVHRAGCASWENDCCLHTRIYETPFGPLETCSASISGRSGAARD